MEALAKSRRAQDGEPAEWSVSIDRLRSWPGWAEGGGGGNRTRVRGRTGQSVYKLRLPL